MSKFNKAFQSVKTNLEHAVRRNVEATETDIKFFANINAKAMVIVGMANLAYLETQDATINEVGTIVSLGTAAVGAWIATRTYNHAIAEEYDIENGLRYHKPSANIE